MLVIDWKMAQKDSNMDGFKCEGRILSEGPGIWWSNVDRGPLRQSPDHITSLKNGSKAQTELYKSSRFL